MIDLDALRAMVAKVDAPQTDYCDRMDTLGVVWKQLPALLDELAAARRDAERGCWWARDGEDSDTWQTKCGHWFTVNEGTPSDNEMQYCPFCAGKIDDTDETDDAARGER